MKQIFRKIWLIVRNLCNPPDYVFADELVDENGKPLVSEDSEDITEG